MSVKRIDLTMKRDSVDGSDVKVLFTNGEIVSAPLHCVIFETAEEEQSLVDERIFTPCLHAARKRDYPYVTVVRILGDDRQNFYAAIASKFPPLESQNENNRRNFLKTSVAVVGGGLAATVSKAEADQLKRDHQGKLDRMLFVITTTEDSMFTSQDLRHLRDCIECVFLDKPDPNAEFGVIQLAPGMKMEMFGGNSEALRKVKSLTVVQEKPR